MVRVSLLFCLAILAVVPSILLGAEVPVEPVDGGTALPSWLTFILSFEFIWKALLTVGGTLFAWLAKMMVAKAGEDQAKKDAILALEAAVSATYEEFVRQTKQATADGKLSDAERKAARNMAITKAKEIATGAGLKLLKSWGAPILESLVEKIVSKMKESKKVENK